MDNWRKSERSSAQGGECVEVASGQGEVAVRDTANRAGAALAFTASAWAAFLGRVK